MSNWLKALAIFPVDRNRSGSGRGKSPWPAILILLVAAMVLSPSLRYRFLALVEYPFHYEEYKEFGIRIPAGFEVHGIDVSRYQERVDWERVAAMRVGEKRISFAFIKATEGTWMTDPRFKYNWQHARKHGIIRGAYHYFLPNVSPQAQARHFGRTVRLQSGDLPPVVDVEETRGMTAAQVRKYTKDFLVRLHNQQGVKPIVYTNRDFYKLYFADRPEFKPYCFWIAHYDVLQLEMPDDSKWHFWQHSDKGTVNGINEPVDFNVFYSDSLTLQKLCVP
ncbi:MAG: glycoside hydrolase family 25 protein [Bacteroidetes bacterium]|nr:MAG: glycoside hydrolase family 25 protein [Bacteroidota bacterium]